MDRQRMTADDIEQAALDALRTSMGGPDTDVGIARLRNIEFYNAEPTGELAPPEIEDRSDFVATDVADTIDGMLPQLLHLFVTSDDAVEFEAKSIEAEPQAKLATAYVNHLFYVQNDGLLILHDWFKDALLQKVGYVKVWAEEEAEDVKSRYTGLVPEQVAMLAQDGWELDGNPEQAEDGTLSVVLHKEDRRMCIKARAVPPVSMRIDANARYDDEPAMVGEVLYRRRMDWEEDGYDLSDVGYTGEMPTDSEMLEMQGEAEMDIYAAPHGSHELIKGAEVYIKLDADGDGVAEWLKVCLIGEKLAVYTNGEDAIDQVDDHPYVWICPIPRSHSFIGDCPADRAIQPQKLRTRTVRAIEDGLYLSVNPRTYVNTSASVNIDDVLDNRPGGVIRGQGPANVAVQALATPNLGAPAYQFNEYIASWAENRTGFNRYSAGTDQNALNKTARGMELLTSKADMRMQLMARFFAVGVRKLFAKMLKLATQFQNVPEMVKVGGQFVPINPSEFKNQFNVKINVGLGNGSKEQLSARIMGLLGVMQGGIPLGVVSPDNIAEAIRLYAEANEFKNPERFVSPQPPGPPPQVQQMMAQMQQMQQQMAQMQEQLKSKEGDLAIKQQGNELKAADLALKADKQAHDAFMDEAELAAKYEAQALEAEVQAIQGMSYDR